MPPAPLQNTTASGGSSSQRNRSGRTSVTTPWETTSVASKPMVRVCVNGPRSVRKPSLALPTRATRSDSESAPRNLAGRKKQADAAKPRKRARRRDGSLNAYLRWYPGCSLHTSGRSSELGSSGKSELQHRAHDGEHDAHRVDYAPKMRPRRRCGRINHVDGDFEDGQRRSDGTKDHFALESEAICAGSQRKRFGHRIPSQTTLGVAQRATRERGEKEVRYAVAESIAFRRSVLHEITNYEDELARISARAEQRGDGGSRMLAVRVHGNGHSIAEPCGVSP